MSVIDTLKNKLQEVTGVAKKTAGALTGNKQQEAEGKADRAKANLKQAGEKLKGVFK